MERRQMGKQRGGWEVVLRRMIPALPAKEHSQVFMVITGQSVGNIFSNDSRLYQVDTKLTNTKVSMGQRVDIHRNNNILKSPEIPGCRYQASNRQRRPWVKSNTRSRESRCYTHTFNKGPRMTIIPGVHSSRQAGFRTPELPCLL